MDRATRVLAVVLYAFAMAFVVATFIAHTWLGWFLAAMLAAQIVLLLKVARETH